MKFQSVALYAALSACSEAVPTAPSFFQQRVDHFDDTNTDAYSQRYCKYLEVGATFEGRTAELKPFNLLQ